MKGMCDVDMVYMYTGHFAAFSHYRRTVPLPAAAMEKFASPILYYIEFTDFQKPAENARILCNKIKTKLARSILLLPLLLSILGYCVGNQQ